MTFKVKVKGLKLPQNSTQNRKCTSIAKNNSAILCTGWALALMPF